MREDKSLLAEILDTLLLTVVIAAFAFVFARTRLSAPDSAFAAVCVAFVIAALLRKSNSKKRSEHRLKKKCEAKLAELTYAGTDMRLEYFERALKRFNPIRDGDRLVINGRYVYCPFLPPAALAAECVRIHEICVADDKRAVLILPKAPDAATAAFIEGSSRLKVLTGEKLEKLTSDMPDEPTKPKQRRKGRFKKLFSAATQRGLFRRYLMTGALLIGTSYILPSSPLYIACGALCLTLALVCLLPRGNKSKG